MKTTVLSLKHIRHLLLLCVVLIEQKEGQLSSPNEKQAANDQEQNQNEPNATQWPRIGVLYEPPPPEKIKKGKPIKRVQTEPIPPNDKPLNKSPEASGSST
ncbi:MAG: hypothetical protein ACRCYO_09555 [Bacteroidia bacterium]